MEQKANRAEVPTVRQLEDSAVKGSHSWDNSSVTTQVRLKEISAAVQRKADLAGVATLAQFNRLVAMVEQKANSKDVAAPSQVAQLLAALERKADADGVPSLPQFRELAEAVGRKADAAGAASLEELRALRAELERLGRAPPVEPPEARHARLVLAAAGTRLERQLRELRQEVRELRAGADPAVGPSAAGLAASADARWPGRILPPAAAASDAASAAGSEASLANSLASCSGSLAALGPEERAELGRIRAVLGAAGTAFSRDLREVRGQLWTLRAELQRVKEALGERLSGVLAPPDGSERQRRGG